MRGKLRPLLCTGLAAAVAGAAFGQSAGPVFEIADVHVSPSTANPYTYLSGGVLRGGRYDLWKATMLDLVRIAWAVLGEKVLGGPNWLELDRFDVSAKAPPSTSPETIRLMLQALLLDRFKLVLHNDVRPMPAYVLAQGKGKPKLKEASGAGETGCRYQQAAGAMFSCRNMTMEALAQQLPEMASNYIRDSVVDSTGLQGAWDFDLKWDGRFQALQVGAERVTVFDAIEKQLGLTLELQKAPTAVLVIDRVNEKPTANPPGVAKVLPPPSTEFEVADVRPSSPDERSVLRVTPGGGLEARATTMKILIGTAWDMDWDHVDEMVAGLPKWADSARFDIVAKASTETSSPSPRGSGFIDDDIRRMLRALLIDRFRIASHFEDRPVSAYSLVAVKPKLTKADPANRSSCQEARTVANDPRNVNRNLSRLLQCRNVTMAQFAKLLQSHATDYFAREVADATGISGAWDFTLSFSPKALLQSAGSGGDSVQPGDASPSVLDPSGALSLFDAVSKQLGLKLETRKRMLPVLVIDHIDEKPTDN